MDAHNNMITTEFQQMVSDTEQEEDKTDEQKGNRENKRYS